MPRLLVNSDRKRSGLGARRNKCSRPGIGAVLLRDDHLAVPLAGTPRRRPTPFQRRWQLQASGHPPGCRIPVQGCSRSLLRQASRRRTQRPPCRPSTRPPCGLPSSRWRGEAAGREAVPSDPLGRRPAAPWRTEKKTSEGTPGRTADQTASVWPVSGFATVKASSPKATPVSAQRRPSRRMKRIGYAVRDISSSFLAPAGMDLRQASVEREHLFRSLIHPQAELLQSPEKLRGLRAHLLPDRHAPEVVHAVERLQTVVVGHADCAGFHEIGPGLFQFPSQEERSPPVQESASLEPRVAHPLGHGEALLVGVLRVAMLPKR